MHYYIQFFQWSTGYVPGSMPPRFDPLADDRAFILNAMGVTLRAIQKDTRPGAYQWDPRASHWRVTIKRGKGPLFHLVQHGSGAYRRTRFV